MCPQEPECLAALGMSHPGKERSARIEADGRFSRAAWQLRRRASLPRGAGRCEPRLSRIEKAHRGRGADFAHPSLVGRTAATGRAGGVAWLANKPRDQMCAGVDAGGNRDPGREAAGVDIHERVSASEPAMREAHRHSIEVACQCVSVLAFHRVFRYTDIPLTRASIEIAKSPFSLRQFFEWPLHYFRLELKLVVLGARP